MTRRVTEAPLFEFDFSPSAAPALTPGMIVRQCIRSAGLRGVLFPYWQVLSRHPESQPLRTLWLCRAAPVSEYPGQLHVFETGEIEPTGVSWQVPTHQQIDAWVQQEWGINLFTAKLNFQADGSVFLYRPMWAASGAPGTLIRETEQGVYVKLPPLGPEADLLARMSALPYQCGRWTRHGGLLAG